MELKRISIEISTLCNANCITCPHEKIERNIYIDSERIIKLIKEDCIVYRQSIDFFEFHNYNEPFLTFNMLNFLGKLVNEIYGSKKIGIVTNGSIMSEGIAKKLLNLDLSHLYISVDGYSKEIFESHRLKLNRDKVYANIDFLLNYFQKHNGLHPYISFVVTEKNKHEIPQFIHHFEGKHCHISFQDCDGRGGEDKEPYLNDISNNTACDWALGTVYILSNLDVVPCCLDWSGSEVMGNLKNQTLQEVFEGPKYQYFRDKHLSGEKSQIKLCSLCKSNLIENYDFWPLSEVQWLTTVCKIQTTRTTTMADTSVV